MPILKELLRSGLLERFFVQAERLLSAEGSFQLFHEGAPLLVRGAPGSYVLARQEIAPRFGLDEEGVMSTPLEFADGDRGILALRLENPAGLSPSEVDYHQGLLEFMSVSTRGFADLESARRSIAAETLSKYRELALLHRAILDLNDSLRLKDVVGSLLAECRAGAIPAEGGMVFLKNLGEGPLKPFDSFGQGIQDLAGIKDTTFFQQLVESGKGEIVNDTARDSRLAGKLPHVGAVMAMPISSPGEVVGLLVLSSSKANPFNAAHLKHLATLASVAGIAVSNAYNFESIQRLMEALLKALAEAIDARDPYTAGHSERVARLGVALARIVNDDERFCPGRTFTEAEVRELYYAGILHDVGKIGIREEVLTKSHRLHPKTEGVIRMRLALYGEATGNEWRPDFERLQIINKSFALGPGDVRFINDLAQRRWRAGEEELHLLEPDEKRSLLLEYGNLTPEERREIQRHPVESCRILQHIPFREDFQNLLTIILQHHERLDGSGYPDGLTGEDLLLQSQIMAIVDIYDAITQERHYKPAALQEEALLALRQEADFGKLDAGLVELFAENITEIEEDAILLKFKRWYSAQGL
jgi:HD-GYP domain-containing protein (c-di-GMP phosphodiesterase class II)